MGPPVQPAADLTERSARLELKALFMRALQLRILVALALHLFVADDAFAPDQLTYHQVSSAIANYWTGSSAMPIVLKQGEAPGYYYVVALVYSVVGNAPLVPKLLNAFVGAYTVRVIFELALQVTGVPASALRVAKYVAYFPSLVLWSSVGIRDCWLVLLLALMCRNAMRLQDRFSGGTFFLLCLTIYAVTQFRAYLLFVTTLPMVISFAVRNSRHLLRNTVVAMLLAVALIQADQAAGKERQMRGADLEQLNTLRKWSATAQSGFAADADISTPAGAAAFLPIGLTYFLLAPFPWMLASAKQSFAAVEMIFFYTLIIPMFRGAAHLLRTRASHTLLVVLITSTVTIGYALGQGNIGTLYRHRAQVLPFLLLFAAYGVEIGLKRRARAAPPTNPQFAASA